MEFFEKGVAVEDRHAVPVRFTMTNYYDAASTLNHEDDHASGLTDNGFDHFNIGVREAENRFKSKVSKYYGENLIYNMKDYLRDQVNAILTFKNNGDQNLNPFTGRNMKKMFKHSTSYLEK